MEEMQPPLQAGSKPHLEKLTLGITRILGEWGRTMGGRWVDCGELDLAARAIACCEFCRKGGVWPGAESSGGSPHTCKGEQREALGSLRDVFPRRLPEPRLHP